MNWIKIKKDLVEINITNMIKLFVSQYTNLYNKLYNHSIAIEFFLEY